MFARYDSKNLKYKTPFGAVTCGTEVTFYVACDETVRDCSIQLVLEFANDFLEYPMKSCDFGFQLSIPMPNAPDLVWYAFSLTDKNGNSAFLSKSGITDKDGIQYYQQTVYVQPKDFPSWFGKGITYQIFPDRFFHDGPEPAPRNNRVLHASWDEDPIYLPNENGEVQNNDFFGGNLKGIIAKLSYLSELGITTIYLNPIVESFSNHHYDTGNYLKIDEWLGNDNDFKELCQKASALGIYIILDGVFNHTGSDSIYFNAKGSYDSLGAAQDLSSPYASWYQFTNWPNEYAAWWGVKTLPAVNENDPSYRDFIIRSQDSVVRHYLKLGASGWRLDVADELPDDFIEEIRFTMSDESSNSFLLGEVWEDGSNKIAYSQRRKYLLGSECNGLMNYPLRTAILSWLLEGNAQAFVSTMEELRENYPKEAFYNGLNILGTHDTVRILTSLGIHDVPYSKDDRANRYLTKQEFGLGLARLKLASSLLFCFPGSPTIYYGDEVGMQGFEDPFCRRTFPWNNRNDEIYSHYQSLCSLRNQRRSLQEGSIEYLYAESSCLCFKRTYASENTYVLLNAGSTTVNFDFDWHATIARDALSKQQFLLSKNHLYLQLPAMTAIIVTE